MDSSVLHPSSNRLLIKALEMIQTNPAKRVLIAGHTDSTGSPAHNLTLSVARATAVRDWLIDASGLPPEHFAIQGYGATRPKASNATAAGRAVNRRVEITLIPECRAPQPEPRGNSSSPQAQPACSYQ
jgi:outer membrane protein OmpA-like peptidoglycan-associated protein